MITDAQYELKDDVTMDSYMPKLMTNCEFMFVSVLYRMTLCTPASFIVVLSQQDVGTEVHLLVVSSQSMLSDKQLPLGMFKMKWKRADYDDESVQSAVVSVNLPSVVLKTLPYSISIGKTKLLLLFNKFRHLSICVYTS